MTVLKIVAVVAAVALYCLAFFGCVRWAIREWKKIEVDEEQRRQAGCPGLHTRGGN